MKLAALVFGHALHHLDHLAPLCHFLEMPLIVTDPGVGEVARLFYPGLTVHEMTPLEMSSQMVCNYDAIVSCLSRPLLDPLLLVAEEIYGKRLPSIWCPHGNSDKGHASPLMEGLGSEKLILVYGQKMLDFIAEKNKVVPPYLITGNYRYHHYLHFKSFYDMQMDLFPKRRTLLYAPTWDDAEGSCSFHMALPFLQTEADRLLIKLHPNTLLKSPYLVEKHRDLSFIQSYTPIYPLLARSEAYIGDMSSIGYDYLTFNRPMFFFNPKGRQAEDQGLYLHRCGKTMPANLLSPQENLQEIRKAVYEYTFSDIDPRTLKRAVHEACRSYFW